MPLLFDQQFPSWFAGIAFAAIGIGALVPAAIMSIAAANLFTRNIYKEYFRRDATHAQEANVSKITSLVVKVGAVACIVFLDPQFSIDLQLIGGVIILQTLPAVALGIYTRWFHRGGLIAGWVAGMGLGTWMLYQVPNAATGRKHFGGSAFPLEKFGFDTPKTIYVGLVAVVGEPAGRGPRPSRAAPAKVPRRWRRHRSRTTTSPTRATRGCKPGSRSAAHPEEGRERRIDQTA